MDWLTDKKNQPFVAAGLAVIILGAGVAMYFLYFKQPSVPEPTAETTASTETAAPTGLESGMMGGPTTTAETSAPAQQAAQPPTGKAKPMEAWRDDPFLPPGYKPPKQGGQIRIKRRIDLPTFDLRLGGPAAPPPPPAEQPQPVRRMAGLVLGDKVYAIIEQGGRNQVVQPGDMLEDRLATVFRIEKDRVILRTTDEKPRFITVRMAQGVRTEASTSPGTPSALPPYPGRYPGRGPSSPEMGPAPEGPPPM